jgi:radical SAM protein with 4Fe4S-binding SPASM domain
VLFDKAAEAVKAHLVKTGLIDKMTVGETGLVRPFMLTCETVNICNNQCIICPYTQMKRSKGVMPIDLFRRIIEQYAKIGGGYLSLTPMLGDILLDPHLIERVEIIRRYKQIKPSFTTNLIALDKYSDDEIGMLVESVEKVAVSYYGVTEEEHIQITGNTNFQRVNYNLRRLIHLCKDKRKLSIEFRLLFKQNQEFIEHYIDTMFQEKIKYGWIYKYANWGGTLAHELPGDAIFYKPSFHHQEFCLMPIFSLMIYHDGKVSVCQCCDFDQEEELYVGDINTESILDIFNGELNMRLWENMGQVIMPKICTACSFKIPFLRLPKDHPFFNDITEVIG